MLRKGKIVVVLTAIIILGSAAGIFAMMTGGGMMGGGSMMNSGGGFGMTNGMAAGPLVGSDGTAYIISMVPSATLSTTPTSASFVSHMLAVTPAGQVLKLSINGLMSKPVSANGITVAGNTGNFMISTVSLPRMSDYSMMANYGTTIAQSVVFWMETPFSLTSMPVAVSMDGRYASQPMIANNRIYITTTNNGTAMMQGNDVFNNKFPTYTASNTAASYLYVFKMDGTLVSKTVLK